MSYHVLTMYTLCIIIQFRNLYNNNSILLQAQYDIIFNNGVSSITHTRQCNLIQIAIVQNEMRSWRPISEEQENI